jgi:hypothetical protein
MRNSVLIILMLAIVSCTGKWQPGDQIKNGHDFLCSAGICDDSLNVANEVNYNDDGAALPHHILDLTACQALGIDKVMGVDTAYSVVRVWGVKDLEGKGISLLLGQTSYSDTRTCWLATYGKDGMIDFMRLGECGGMNLMYWDDIDEHTRNVGIDSMRMVMPDKWDKPINVSRWISYNVQRDGVDTDSTLWFIHHELPITIGNDGHFTMGKLGIVYSSDTTLLNNYWRYKRQLEVFSWTPMSDGTLYDRLNNFLEQAKGTITDPTQLLGDFHMLMAGRIYGDPERLMQWCCDHPNSQLTLGMLSTFKDINPEWILNDLKKIKDPALRQRAKQLFGL